MKIWVVGHRNPDADAIISSIAFSEVLRELGYDAIPCRIGEVSAETKEILKRCSLNPPLIIEDVRIRAKDVMSSKVIYSKAGDPAKIAIDILISKKIRSLPIINDERKVLGLFSADSFAEFLMSEISRERLILDSRSLLNFVKISGSKKANSVEITRGGKVYVGAWSVEKIEKSLELLRGNIIITGDRERLHEMAIEAGVSCLIITGGFIPKKEILMRAEEKGIPILVSPHDTYTTLRLMDLSQPVEKFAKPPLLVSEEDLASDVREKMISLGVRSSIVTDEEGKVVGIITRSDLIRDLRRKVALVDHNEFSQSVEGIEDAEIVAVVDHHRISGDVKTYSPIIFRVEPLGATSSLIYKISREKGISLKRNILRAIMYGILADTLLLKSPTCTEEDVKYVEIISEDLEEDLQESLEFVRYCMSLNEPKNPDEMLSKDYKEFYLKNIKFGISQVFTARPEKYLERESLREIKESMDKFRKRRGLDFMILMLTDYLNETSYIISSGKAEILKDALGIDPEADYNELRGVTSRKAQILPKILSKIENVF